ncbi:AAA family ATPase, partial [Psychrobacter sp. DAB_AL32B]|uniref:AAA family ATPase n=1 Tax=Psychrobacter sp. DAB_AL32B TaxID=1028414 RepID=UPI001C2BB9C3
LLKVELPISSNSEVKVKDSFLSWLDDTEVKLSHRLVGEAKLKDIYVTPDIQEYDENTERLIDIHSSDTVLANYEDFIIFGDEQIGKTSLLKYFYIEMLKKKELCIYLDAKKINNNFDKVLSEGLGLQYDNLSLSEYFSAEKKIILIDDFEKISLKPKNIGKFIEFLREKSVRMVFLCESNYSYISSDIACFDKFRKPRLLELGHQKREELIGKWISLGKPESISSEEENYRQIDL